MSAAEALRAARDAGVGLHVDGVDLVLEASAPPSAAVLHLLTRHKADLILLLRPGDDGWSAEDWRAFYDERAGIAVFDGGLPCPDAETLASGRRALEGAVQPFDDATFERDAVPIARDDERPLPDARGKVSRRADRE